MRQVGSAREFDRFISKSRKPVFVDFWAPGCSACEAMEPRVERLEERYRDRVRFAGLDIEGIPKIADRFHVRSIPHFAVFVDGSPGRRVVGEVPQRQLEHLLRAALRKAGKGESGSEITQGEELNGVDQLAEGFASMRGRDLLVLYWPDEEEMEGEDVEELYDEFIRRGAEFGRLDLSLDVLVHTLGGSPEAGYRMAQLIRDFSRDVVILVPYHAFSAGTLLSLCGDRILLGHCALLSPIDITLAEDGEGEPEEGDGGEPEEDLELTSIDGYLEFVEETHRRMQLAVPEVPVGEQVRTRVEDALMEALVSEVGAMNIGRYYRERTVTSRYAEVLLEDYMLRDAGEGERQGLIRKLVFESPSHDFEIDYHLAKRWGLSVEEMGREESETIKGIVRCLQENGGQERFIRLYRSQPPDSAQAERA